MKLLIFAHRGEAQCFLDNWDFSPVDFFFNGLFRSKDYFLLLTGEGPREASEKTVATLAQFQEDITEIINIGVAGTLCSKLSINDLVWVRSSYATLGDSKCEFKSFNTQSHQNIDCITSSTRITSNEDKKRLSHFADIVDRELWSIMSAAHLFKKEIRSLKIISDTSDSTDFCEIVKDEALKLSRELLRGFLEHQESIKESKEIDLTISSDNSLWNFFVTHENLYFTTSQERKLKTILNGFSVKKNLSEQKIKELTNNIVTTELDRISKKEISKLVINELNDKLNPLNSLIKNKINQALRPLIDSGVNVSVDPELEREYVQINYQIKNERDLKKLILALDYFNFKKIQDIFKGNFDHDV